VRENENKKCSYNLILMDGNMPFMDGYQSTIKIRQYLYDMEIDQPLIVAVTGHTEQQYIQKAI
jgi:CheY-like chemotaxis protein